MHRAARFLVAGLLAVGILLSFSVARGEAQPTAVGVSAKTSGYAYSKAATPDAATLVNASSTRADDGTSPTKVLVLLGIGGMILGGAVFEGLAVRRRGGH